MLLAQSVYGVDRIFMIRNLFLTPHVSATSRHGHYGIWGQPHHIGLWVCDQWNRPHVDHQSSIISHCFRVGSWKMGCTIWFSMLPLYYKLLWIAVIDIIIHPLPVKPRSTTTTQGSCGPPSPAVRPWFKIWQYHNFQIYNLREVPHSPVPEPALAVWLRPPRRVIMSILQVHHLAMDRCH